VGADARGKVTASTSTANEAQRVAADPQGAARGEAEVRVDQTVDQKTGGARGDANEVRGAVENPEGTAQARADAKIAEQKRDASASASGDVKVSSDGSASVSTKTDKPGDKK
jgi:hypothetical protein